MPSTGPGDPIAEAFESQRDRLRAVAFRVLGSHADADDVVQEAWLRLSRQDTATVHNLAGWLTTVVARISLDVLRSRRTRCEVLYDDQPPGPTAPPDDAVAPDDDAALTDSVGLALLVVLDALRPDERLALVLHDAFAVPHEEIASILGRSTDATKMLTSRARRKVRLTQRSTGPRRQQREVVQAFLEAARDGRFDQLLQVLHPEVELTTRTPGGPVVTLGATDVAARAQLAAAAARGHAVTVDGHPGLISWREDGTPLSVLTFTVTDGRIIAITAVIDPAELARMDLPDPV